MHLSREIIISVLNISVLYMEQGVEVREAHVSPDSLYC